MRIRGWQQWLVMLSFFVVITITTLFAVRTVRQALYWHNHRDEPIHGWMTVGYVAYSYHVTAFYFSRDLSVWPRFSKYVPPRLKRNIILLFSSICYPQELNSRAQSQSGR